MRTFPHDHQVLNAILIWNCKNLSSTIASLEGIAVDYVELYTSIKPKWICYLIFRETCDWMY